MKSDREHQHRLLQPICTALNEQLIDFNLLGTGAFASAWHLRTDRNSYALKVWRPDARRLSPRTDAALRRFILAGGGRVPVPYLNSDDLTVPGLVNGWSLDGLAPGRSMRGRALSTAQLAQIGTTLRLLHSIDPVAIPGGADLPHALPLGPQRLREQLPWNAGVCGASMSLSPEVQSALDRIFFSPTTAPTLCHADLHADQIMVAGQRDLTLLDFGDARLCDPRWDLGALLFLLGPTDWERLANAYGAECPTQAEVLPFAWAFALARLVAGGRSRATKAHFFLRQSGALIG